MIRSDLHIHSEYSYDASLTLDTLAAKATEQGLVQVGVTDHANFNDEKFLSDIRRSAEAVARMREEHSFMLLGVELTPIAKPEFDYIAKHGSNEGYIPPESGTPYGIELAATKEELKALGVRYAIGASHWRVDLPNAKSMPTELGGCIKEWYRQQMWLACDERVTILGHPWYHGGGIWYEDFDVIPRSMKMDIAAALKENGKIVECNSHFFYANRASEKFRHQYAEYLREMFEMGIRVSYGSDSHNGYSDLRPRVEEYLGASGFRAGDITTLCEEDLW